MDGAVMSNILKIAMMFAITGQPFTGIGNWASSILICVLCGVVTSAIPGAGMIGAVIIMDFFGFPTELFPIIASLTFLVDPLATMNNCTGDCSASMLVTLLSSSQGPRFQTGGPACKMPEALYVTHMK